MTGLLCLAAALAAPPAAPAADPVPSVCRVWSGGYSCFGTGTVVAAEAGRSLVLTNAHVVRRGGPVHVDCGGRRYDAAVVAVAAADLAVVRVAAELTAAEVAAADPAPGSVLRQWGCDSTVPNRHTPKAGPLLGPRGWDPDYGRPLQTVGLVAVPGDSGSGLFDAGGRLCAVTARGGPRCPTAGAVPLADVRAFLRAEARDWPRLAAALKGGAP